MRSLTERLLRAMAVVTLLAAWWLTGRPSASEAVAFPDAVDTSNPARLAEALANPSRTAVHANLRELPNSVSRAVLHAARQAGVAVSWTGDSSATPLVPLAMSVSPLADPRGGVTVRVSAPGGSQLSLGDSLGWIDSAVVINGGLTWPLDGNPRELTVSSGLSRAIARPIPLAPIKRIRVFAVPGWEARFAMRALEDAGWDVDASFSVAPRVAITAGAPGALDTARYAAVIAIDSAAWSSASSIAAFVRSGGGLVLFPAAASGGALSALRAGVVGEPSAGVPGALALGSPREGLGLRPITALRSDAVVLERSTRPGSPVVMAARRVGSGRVLQVGWENSWEWRMLGVDRAVADHRDWWRALLHRTAQISPAGASTALPLPGDAAPYADLVARLGRPSPPVEALSSAETTPAPPPPWLFTIAALALLVEWWSRRLRGAR